jgi:hypothetical protein
MSKVNPFAKMLLIALCPWLIVGCSTFAKQYEADPIIEHPTELLKTGSETKIDEAVLRQRIKDATSDSARNKLITELLILSDRVCSLHQAEIIANINAMNLLTGTATNILSGLGTVLAGETTKAALAAGAALTSGTRSLINEEVYAQAMGTTIARAISVAREKYYADIKGKMVKEIKNYTIEDGVLDVQEYHRRCSFYYGLLEVTKSLEQRKSTKGELEYDIQTLRTQRDKLKTDNSQADVTAIDIEIQKRILLQADAPN